MPSFTIYPAIDLRHGRVVRLQHGDPDRQTIFGDDPVQVAGQWLEAGATWLHMVNLDGAFGEQSTNNWAMLRRLTQLGAQVQFGGGLRTLADIERALVAGAERVVLGTAAVEDPGLVAAAINAFGSDQVVVGIDARDGRVNTRGWQQGTAVTPIELGRQMKALGTERAVYTDISRDGVLTGVDAAGAAELAQTVGLQVIAPGGVASLADVRRVYALAGQGVAGVIIGRALYEGQVDLRQALQIAMPGRRNPDSQGG